MGVFIFFFVFDFCAQIFGLGGGHGIKQFLGPVLGGYIMGGYIMGNLCI